MPSQVEAEGKCDNFEMKNDAKLRLLLWTGEEWKFIFCSSIVNRGLHLHRGQFLSNVAGGENNCVKSILFITTHGLLTSPCNVFWQLKSVTFIAKFAPAYSGMCRIWKIAIPETWPVCKCPKLRPYYNFGGHCNMVSISHLLLLYDTG